jgi:hypothetical protein
MTAALTPALALDFVRELSADVLAGVVLDAEGTLLAGPAVLADPARALLAAAEDAAEVEGATRDGAAFAARDGHHAIVVVTGRFALSRLTRHDLRTALAALRGDAPREGDVATAPPGAVSALLEASRRLS